jgi:hypothetical protein
LTSSAINASSTFRDSDRSSLTRLLIVFFFKDGKDNDELNTLLNEFSKTKTLRLYGRALDLTRIKHLIDCLTKN